MKIKLKIKSKAKYFYYQADSLPQRRTVVKPVKLSFALPNRKLVLQS